MKNEKSRTIKMEYFPAGTLTMIEVERCYGVSFEIMWSRWGKASKMQSSTSSLKAAKAAWRKIAKAAEKSVSA